VSDTRHVALMLELGWPFARHVDVFIGTQRYAQGCGNWQCHVDEYAHARLPARRGMDLPYDGIIARATPELAERARQCGVPVVNVWFNSPATELPAVFPDNVSNGQLAAEHLMQRGYRRFACLTERRDRSHDLIGDLFCSTVGEHGFDCKKETTVGDYTINATPRAWQAFEKKIEAWIDSWKLPIGVFVVHDDITSRHVTLACQRRGLQFPDDVGLIVSENAMSMLLNPPPSLTSLKTDYEEVGFQAAQMLDRLMDGEPESNGPVVIGPNELVVRQSTGFISTEDDLVRKAIRYINEHSDKPIGVEEVVQNLYGSRRTLERRFRASLGRSVAGEIRRLRVERAKQFLSDTDLSFAAVAKRCGFHSAQSLCEIFHREAGLTPSEFRVEENLG
jgi:LacI family transcriptional regulator